MSFHHLRAAQNHMATTFDFIISCEEPQLELAEHTLRTAHERVTQLEKELSEFLVESPIAQLNEAPLFKRVSMPRSAFALIQRSAYFTEISGGAFNCLAKSKNPSEAKIAWDDSTQEAWRETEGTHVGFGAIGKGYALDDIRPFIESQGFTNYNLNAGGSSILISGMSAPGEPWSWGWSWAKDEKGEPLGLAFNHIPKTAIAIGVSGLQERGEHIINPATSEPSRNAQSALVGSDSATEADALSTALFVGGWNHSLKRFSKLTRLPALAVIEKDGTPRWNGVFQHLWGTMASLLFLMFTCKQAFADDTVNLNDLGVSDFTPYMFERSRWWILLPAFALGVVLLHLKNSKPRLGSQKKPWEETK
jgi:FAD:protein FMN transferase